MKQNHHTIILGFDSYVLEFDDDEEEGALPQRVVPFHRVVALPEGYRQWLYANYHCKVGGVRLMYLFRLLTKTEFYPLRFTVSLQHM